MKKVLLTFGSGGHSAQAGRLYKEIKNDYKVDVLIEKCDPISEKKFSGATIYKVILIRPKESFFLVPYLRLLVCFVESFFVMLKSRPDVIISTGPGIAIPISVWGKIFRKKVIFIESWSRVTEKSFAGKYMYKIADEFFVQWPEMEKEYPRAINAGRFG